MAGLPGFRGNDRPDLRGFFGRDFAVCGLAFEQ